MSGSWEKCNIFFGIFGAPGIPHAPGIGGGEGSPSPLRLPPGQVFMGPKKSYA